MKQFECPKNIFRTLFLLIIIPNLIDRSPFNKRKKMYFFSEEVSNVPSYNRLTQKVSKYN